MVVDEEGILAAFAESERSGRRVRELTGWLLAFVRGDTIAQRADGLAGLVHFVMQADARLPLPPSLQAAGAGEPAYRRLAVLLALLEQPALAEAFGLQLAALLSGSDGVPLFAETGLPNDRGLVHETADRLFRRILPAPRDDHDLSVLLLRLFPERRQLDWLQGVPAELFERLFRLVAASAGERLLAAVWSGVVLICARVQALGLSHALRERGRPQPVARSPFFLLPRAGDQLLATMERPAGRAAAQQKWEESIDGCRQELEAVHARLEATGISLDVVYATELIKQALVRLERLAEVLMAAAGAGRAAPAHRLLLVLVRARLSDRSLRALGYTNLQLLARKLVERAGATGEHYITSSRREYWQMLGSAAGGGVLTLGTIAAKLQIVALHAPLFVEGMLASGSYALSFILIQILGFTLATKQPSMTAATLAAAIGDREVVASAARIVRSQLAAAVGNVLTVSVAAVMFDNFWHWRYGQAYLATEKAARVLASLDPLHSGTIWYAALTGAFLWASSLAGGWLENFSVYRRLPQAIAEHRLGRWLGAGLMRRLSESYARNVSGWGGSVALGLMLGMAPSLGAFFGLPLDVRHVTLSTGSLALALAAGDWAGLREPPALAAMAGIAVIFVLNLSVSFLLALTVALRAREVPRRARWALLGAILRRFLRHPGEFLLPPRR